ncbi:SPX domain-containing protein, partial [Coprinopsis sp. MPI-PUGE-AT-0042]
MLIIACARYLNDTQTPEWKKAYIDYRGLKKRITAIRKAQQGQHHDGSGSDTPLAPPASPRTSSVGTGRESIDAKEIRTSGEHAGPSINRRKSVSRKEHLGRSTGVQGRATPELPRRPSIFGRTKTYSHRFSVGGLPAGDRLKALPLHELMTHLGPLEIAFFTLLDAQLDKVDSFYTAREQEMMQRGTVLEEQLRELTEHRRLYIAANAKVPWAAALAYALRPKTIQLKVTRTLSHGGSRHAMQSESLFARMRNAAQAVPAFFGRPGPNHGMVELTPQETRQDGRSVAEASPEQPASPIFGPDADNYLYAKRKLKKAVVEHYRGLELLHNYRVLNLTGFRKALKKFEKVTKIPVQEQYLAERVEKSAFASDKALQKMMRDTEITFATSFVHGNQKKAMKRLRGGTRIKSHHFSTWRSGLLLGLAIPAIISGFFHAFEERTMEAMPAWEALMMVYAVLLIPTVFSALVGLNLLVWAKSRINYVFIF